MFLYYTRGLVRWVGGVHCGDMGAMKAEARLGWSLPEILAMHIRVIAGWQWDTWSQGWWAITSTQLAMDAVGSRVMDVSTVAGVRERRRVRSCFAACVLLCSLVAALRREALAFCLLRCCCVAVPCPLTPGEQTGQRPSPLLMLTLCSCHCPQSLVDRYPRSSGSSVMLWATSGSPGTHGIERGRNHLSARDAR